MSFDAGSIIAHLDLEDAEFDRKLRRDVARIEAFERRTRTARIGVEMDESGLARARRQFERFDNQVTQDAARRSRTRGSVLGALAGMFGGGRGGGFLGGLAGGAGPVPTGLGALGLRNTLLATGGSLGLAALPALLGGIAPLGVAGLGAGVLGLGARTLIGSRQQQGPLYAQATSALATIRKTFEQSTSTLVGPLLRALGEIPGLIRKIGPDLRAMFAGAATLIQPVLHGLADLAHMVLPLLGKAFRATAPLIRPLLDGFGKLLSGLLPGLISLLHAARPAVTVLSHILGMLGSNLGVMLRDMAPAVRASSVIFKALGDVLAAIFPIVGKLAAVFARDLAPVFIQFAGVIRQLLPFLTIIGRVIASLAGAALKDLVALFGAFARLLVDISPAIRILATALEQVFNVLENSGVFAVLADALEKVVPSLAQLINLLVRQLAPDLPVLTQALTVFANLLITLVAAGLNTILQGVTALLRHFPFLVPLLGVLTAAWAAWDVVMSANPIGLIIIAIAALVGAITLLVTHWHRVWTDIKNWAMDAWNFLTHGWGRFLIPQLTAIRFAVEFVRDHWRQAWNVIKGDAQSAWNFLVNDIFHPLRDLLTNVMPSWWHQAVSAIGTAWKDVENAVRAPVAWVIDHVIDGLISAFDWVSGKVGGPHIPAVHPFGLYAGGRIPGYGGGDRVPALLEPGETVITKEDSTGLAGLFRMMGVRGYQHGGIIGDIGHGLSSLFHGITGGARILAALATGNTAALANALKSMFPSGAGGAVGDLAGLLTALPRTLIADAVKTLISTSAHLFTSAGGAGGRGGLVHPTGSGGSIEALMRSMAASIGWTGALWAALFNVEMREAGFNMFARNPGSGAYGLAQFIDGPAEYYRYGGNPNTAAGQIIGMLNYIRQRYGNPLGAWAHELSAGWYDNSGWLGRGPTLAFNATGRREAVLNPDQSEAFIALAAAVAGRGSGGDMTGLLARLDRLIKAAEAAPGKTAGGMAEALTRAGRRSAYSAAYGG